MSERNSSIRIIAADRLVGSENARLHRADEPGQVGLPPDVMMAVDDRDHAALRCVEAEHMVDDRRRRAAVDHFVDEARDRDQRLGLRLEILSDRERRQPAHAPGAPRKLGDGVAHRQRIAALETVGDDQHESATGIAGEARHGEKGLQSVADPRAAVPVAHQLRGGGERLFAALQMHRARHAGKAGAEGEDFDARQKPGRARAQAEDCPPSATSSSRRRRSAAESCAAARGASAARVS